METILPTSAAAATIFLIFSLAVVFAASNSCNDAKGEFSLDLITVVITVITIGIPFIIAGLTDQFRTQTEAALKKKSETILEDELKKIRTELIDLIDFDVSKEELAKFRDSLGLGVENLDTYIQVLYACKDVEEWIADEHKRKTIAFEVAKFTLEKNGNKVKLTKQFKAQFLKDIVRHIYWLYESIKVNTPQELSPQQKSEMVCASPNELSLYTFAHNHFIDKKIPKRLSKEGKAVITRYIDILRDQLKGSQQP